MCLAMSLRWRISTWWRTGSGLRSRTGKKPACDTLMRLERGRHRKRTSPSGLYLHICLRDPCRPAYLLDRRGIPLRNRECRRIRLRALTTTPRQAFRSNRALSTGQYHQHHHSDSRERAARDSARDRAIHMACTRKAQWPGHRAWRRHLMSGHEQRNLPLPADHNIHTRCTRRVSLMTWTTRMMTWCKRIRCR